MMIPHRMLSPEALRGVIEAFITREGTDYGLHEVPLATKVGQVRHQLDAGTVVIIYDEATDSWTIQPTDQRSELPFHTDLGNCPLTTSYAKFAMQPSHAGAWQGHIKP
jgi:uncharacterized protein